MGSTNDNPLVGLSEYELRNLVMHLAEARRAADLHRLLAYETTTGSNAWFDRKDALGDTSGYLTDVARVWKLAEQSYTDSRTPQAIALQCRYALVVASLKALSTDVPPLLLVALVEKGVWSPGKALTYALASEYYSAEALAALAQTLPEQLLRETLQMAKAITREEARATALARLAPRLAQLGHTTDALDAIRNVKRPSLRAGLLGALGSALPQSEQCSFLLGAFELALAIEDVDERANALQGLAPYLTEPLLSGALEAARAIPHERRRDYSLVKFAARIALLGDPQKALEIALAIVDSLSRATALAAVAPHLPLELARRALVETWKLERIPYWLRAPAMAELATRLAALGEMSEAWDAMRGIEVDSVRVVTLARIAQHLAPPEREETFLRAMASIDVIVDEMMRSETLARLAEFVPEALLPKLLDLALEATTKSNRLAALGHLAPLLPEQTLRGALASALAINDETQQAHAVGKLASCLAPSEHDLWLRKALEAVRRIQSESGRARALDGLACHLSGSLLDEAMDMTRTISSPDSRAQALAAHAPHLDRLLLGEALESARGIKAVRIRAKVIKKLAPHLNEAALAIALQISTSIDDRWSLLDALESLAPYLSESLVHQALRALDDIDIDSRRLAWTFSALAKRLAVIGRPVEALQALREVRYEESRAGALAEVAPHLPRYERRRRLQEALDAARLIDDSRDRAEALSWVAPVVPARMRHKIAKEAIDAVRRLGYSADSAIMLKRLLPLLTPRMRRHTLQRILKDALSQTDEDTVGALVELAPYLPQSLLRDALKAAWTISSVELRGRVMAALAPRLHGLSANMLYRIWIEALHFSSAQTRESFLESLETLTQHILALGGTKAVTDTLEAIQDVARWWR